jgi:hypothetical protein
MPYLVRYEGRRRATLNKSGSRDGKYISLESRQGRTGRTTIQGLPQQSQVTGHPSVHIAGERLYFRMSCGPSVAPADLIKYDDCS